MVPASFDFWRANLNDASSAGISMPSVSLEPTARLPPSSSVRDRDGRGLRDLRTLVRNPAGVCPNLARTWRGSSSHTASHESRSNESSALDSVQAYAFHCTQERALLSN